MKSVDLARQSNFISFGKVFSTDNPRVLLLYPDSDLPEDVLTETLNELRDGGALTYVEEFR